MFKVLSKFKGDSEGAVTVDWVVLTGALVGLAVAVTFTIGESAMDESSGLGAQLSEITPGGS